MTNNLCKQRGAVLAFSLIMLALLTLVATSMIQQNKLGLQMAENSRQEAIVFAKNERVKKMGENAMNPDSIASSSVSTSTGILIHTDPSNPPLSSDNAAHQCTPRLNSAGDPRQYQLLAGSQLIINNQGDYDWWSPVPEGTGSQAVFSNQPTAGWKQPDGTIPDQSVTLPLTKNSTGASGVITEASCLQDGNTQLCSSFTSDVDTAPYCYPDGTSASKILCTYDAQGIPTNSSSACYQTYDPQLTVLSVIPVPHCSTEIYEITVTTKDVDTNSRRMITSKYKFPCGSGTSN